VVALMAGAALLLPTGAPKGAVEGQPVEDAGFSMVLAGSVIDRDGSVRPGVSVKLFVDGIVAASTTTDAEGFYTLDARIDPLADDTVTVWWVAPGEGRVPELALIRESSADREHGLWGPCVPRIGMLRQQTYSVQLMDREMFRRQLAVSGCVD